MERADKLPQQASIRQPWRLMILRYCLPLSGSSLESSHAPIEEQFRFNLPNDHYHISVSTKKISACGVQVSGKASAQQRAAVVRGSTCPWLLYYAKVWLDPLGLLLGWWEVYSGFVLVRLLCRSDTGTPLWSSPQAGKPPLPSYGCALQHTCLALFYPEARQKHPTNLIEGAIFK